MIVTRDDLDKCKTLKEYLENEFEIKDIGPLDYFIRIEVSRSKLGFLTLKNSIRIGFIKRNWNDDMQTNNPIEGG